MQDLSLHILDIAENAIRARANKIIIEIMEDAGKDRLTVKIEDNGLGMDRKILKRAADPFFTTKENKKFGLGLSLFSQSAEEAGGGIKIKSKKGAGTKITAVFKLSHPDMKPKGDILETMAALVAANPKTRFIYKYKKGDCSYYFDSCDSLCKNPRTKV